MIGVVLREPNIPRLLDQIVEAEEAGVPAVWLTTAGAGRDALTVFAAAAMRTHSVKLGASILPTWPRHPIAVAQQAQVIAALAPGRLRIGLGVANESIEELLGLKWEAPLGHFREYILVLKALLQSGKVDFEGKWFTARARLDTPVDVPVLAGTLRKAAYQLAGELADGAISWLTPVEHARNVSLQALRAGAVKAGRAAPPLILHAPFCLTEDVESVRQATRQQFGSSARRSTYAGLFEEAGYSNLKGELSDELIDDLVIYGTETEVARRLSKLTEGGISEVIAHAVLTGSRGHPEVFAMIAEANKLANNSGS